MRGKTARRGKSFGVTAMAVAALCLLGASVARAEDAIDFMPHGYCYQRDQNLLLLHVIADGLIAASYFCIPIALLYVVKKRGDLPFNWIFWMFGGFIVSCGITHLLEIWTIWHPTYWLAGTLKAVTAVLSLLTAGMMIPLAPKLVALPSPEQLREKNRELQLAMVEQETTEDQLRRTLHEREVGLAALADRQAAVEGLQMMQEALKESQDRLNAILNCAMDAIIAVDEEQRVLIFNAAAERIFERKEASVLGKRLTQFIPERFRKKHDADVQAFRESGTARQGLGVAGEMWGLRASGEEFPMDASISQVEANGKRVYTVILRDLSGGGRAEGGKPESGSGRGRAGDETVVTPRTVLRALVYVAVLSCANRGFAAPARELKTAREVRALPIGEAKAGQPVRVRGVVLVLSGWKNSFFLSDGRTGISVDRNDVVPELHAGDAVEVTGKSSAGLFAPLIISDQIQVLGRGRFPEAPLREYWELEDGAQDSQWVQIHGVVHSARVSESWGRSVLFLKITLLGGSEITARVYNFEGIDAAKLVDAEVTVRGVCGTNFNEARQFIGLRLFVADRGSITINRAAPEDPFGLPAQTPDSLQRFSSSHAPHHRVRVFGTVTYQKTGEGLYLQNDDKGVFVETEETAPVAVGTKVEAVGFVASGAYSPRLSSAIYRVIGQGQKTTPAAVRANEIISTNADGFLASVYDGRLVRIRGTLADRIIGENEDVLGMSDGAYFFRAIVAKPSHSRALSELRPGSKLELTGVVAIQSDQSRDPHGFVLRLRYPDDVTMIHAAPWWDRERRGYAFALVTVTALGSMILLVVMRLKIRQQVDEVRSSLAVKQSTLKALANQEFALDQHSLVAVTDVHGTITHVNDKFCTISQYSREELVGKNHRILNSGHHSREFFQKMYRTIARGGVWHDEIQNRAKDGSLYWVDTTIVPFIDYDGKPREYVAIRADITERKAKEEALRESEERFQAMANGIQQLAWMADADGSIFWYNQRWYEYTGTTFAQMQGWGWQSVHDPARLVEVLAQWKRAIAAGEPFDMEFPLRGADGRFRMFLTRAMPVKGTSSGVVRWFGTNTDISERKEAEGRLARLAEDLLHSQQALGEQERMLQSVLDSMDEGLIAADEDCKFTLWNAAAEKMVGSGPKDIHFKEWSEAYGAYLADGMTLLPAEDSPLVRAVRGESCTMEIILRHPKKRGDVWVEIAGAPVRDGEGVARGGVVAMRDITQRKAAEREIEKLNEDLKERVADLGRSNQELEQFAYVASHDLQEPLRMVASYTQLLRERYRGKLDDTADKFIGYASEGALRMQVLIQDLLAFSRVGRSGGPPEELEMSSVLEGVKANLMAAIQESGALIHYDHLPLVWADRPQMAQLFQNLIGNAIKFRNAPPPEIRVSAERAGTAWLISVCDNGIGIAPDYLENIFVVFQRLHARTEYPGNGIGLAICKKIVEYYGGKIWVESQPGQGSKFQFTLPAAPGKGATNAAPRPELVEAHR